MKKLYHLCIKYVLHILCSPFVLSEQRNEKSIKKILNLLFYHLYKHQMKKWIQDKQISLKIQNNTIYLLTAPTTYTNAVVMAKALESFGFNTRIDTEYDIMEHLNDFNLYIILTPCYFQNNLPINYIAFNFEQSTYDFWFTEDYIHILNESLAILDYTKVNIEYIKKRGISAEKIHYLPMQPESCDVEIIEQKSTDCIFYGGSHVPRRKKMLQDLQQTTSLKVISGVYGDELKKILKKSGIVLNIHSRENAVLETTRLCEAISHGCLVISETCCNYDEFPELCKMVEFVPQGDTKAIAERILYYQANPDKLKEKLIENNRIADSCQATYKEMLKRFLMQFHIMDTNNQNISMPTPTTK